MSTPAAYSLPSDSPIPSSPAWRAYAHLYFPLLAIALLTLAIPQPLEHRALLLASALPTHLLASLVHRPRPRPSSRFTRRSDLRRAAVIFAYGRLLGTPLVLVNYLLDVIASYGVGYFLDRPEGAAPRRSEFFVHLMLTAVSTIAMTVTVPSWGIEGNPVVSVDRCMYRATWMALVDDVVKVLGYPEMGRKRDRLLVVGLQALIIFATVIQLYLTFVVGVRDILEDEFYADAQD
jgi:hypothetical protein